MIYYRLNGGSEDGGDGRSMKHDIVLAVSLSGLLAVSCSSSVTRQEVSATRVSVDPIVATSAAIGNPATSAPEQPPADTRTMVITFTVSRGSNVSTLDEVITRLQQRAGAMGLDAVVTQQSGVVVVVLTAIAEEDKDSIVAALASVSSPVYLRPVVSQCQLVPEDAVLPDIEHDPNSVQYLPLLSDSPIQVCAVGPQQGTGRVFDGHAVAQTLDSGDWVVIATLRPGPDGQDIWNALAATCFAKESTCPTGQIAIDLNGVLQSAPTVNTPTFSGSVQISGDFSQAAAAALADSLNGGALGFDLQVQSTQFHA